MQKKNKTLQLQIRIAPREKAAIQRFALKANMGVSEWVLSRILPQVQRTFQELLGQIKNSPYPKNVLAEIHDLLNDTAGDEFELMTAQPPPALSDYYLNYVAAMVEYAAALKGRKAPLWTREAPALEQPVFASDLESLKLHLLMHSPPPFRRRNIFIDSTIGQRV